MLSMLAFTSLSAVTSVSSKLWACSSVTAVGDPPNVLFAKELARNDQLFADLALLPAVVALKDLVLFTTAVGGADNARV